MTQSSVINIITISFPEAIIITVLGLLAIGKFSYVRNRGNLYKILTLAMSFSILSFFVRKNISSEIENLLISFITFSLLYIFILRLKFYESIMASLLSLILLAVIQTPAIIAVSAITGISLERVVKNDLMLFLFVIPERIIESLLIFLSLRYNIKIIDFERINYKKRDFYIQLFVYIVSICTLIFLTNLMAKLLIYNQNDFINNSANAILLRINIYLTLFVTVILTLAIKNTSDYYKNKNSLNNSELMQSLEYISSLLDEKNYDESKDAIEKLKDHISKQ